MSASGRKQPVLGVLKLVACSGGAQRMPLENWRQAAYAPAMESLTQFNIQDGRGRLLCPACGYHDYSPAPAYFEHGGERMTICSCCLWEPGYDDADARSAADVVAALRDYRMGWNGAAQWLSSNDQPPGWDGQRQLSHLFKIAPYVQ